MDNAMTTETKLACDYSHGAGCLVRVGDEWQCRHQIAAGRAKSLVAVFTNGLLGWKGERTARRQGWTIMSGATPGWGDAEALAWRERQIAAIRAARGLS